MVFFPKKNGLLLPQKNMGKKDLIDDTEFFYVWIEAQNPV